MRHHRSHGFLPRGKARRKRGKARENRGKARDERGKALNAAVSFGVDVVIDPADTRALIAHTFAAVSHPAPRLDRRTKKRAHVDTW